MLNDKIEDKQISLTASAFARSMLTSGKTLKSFATMCKPQSIPRTSHRASTKYELAQPPSMSNMFYQVRTRRALKRSMQL